MNPYDLAGIFHARQQGKTRSVIAKDKSSGMITTTEIERLEAERDRLREALKGQIGVSMHTGNCAYDGSDRKLCNCGIESARNLVDAALHPIEPASEEGAQK